MQARSASEGIRLADQTKPQQSCNRRMRHAHRHAEQSWLRTLFVVASERISLESID